MRGGILNRTFDPYKKLCFYPFVLTIFAPVKAQGRTGYQCSSQAKSSCADNIGALRNDVHTFKQREVTQYVLWPHIPGTYLIGSGFDAFEPVTMCKQLCDDKKNLRIRLTEGALEVSILIVLVSHHALRKNTTFFVGFFDLRHSIVFFCISRHIQLPRPSTSHVPQSPCVRKCIRTLVLSAELGHAPGDGAGSGRDRHHVGRQVHQRQKLRGDEPASSISVWVLYTRCRVARDSTQEIGVATL